MWVPTTKQDRRQLVEDIHNLDVDASARGDLFRHPGTNERYLEVTVGSEAGEWFRLVYPVQLRCPNSPETGYVTTNRYLSTAEWTRKGPGGSSRCSDCDELHALTRENTNLLTS